MNRYERAAQIWPLLAHCAVHRQSVTYDLLGKLVGVPRQALGQLLEPIQSYCLLNELPALTSLVIGEASGMPGRGFIAAADVPAAQASVFSWDWLEATPPSPEDLNVAADQLPSNGAPLPELQLIAAELRANNRASSHDALHALLGRFVLTFQAVESGMANLIVELVGADPEYIGSITAELEFNSKARALDVIYSRHAQINSISSSAPHPEFHGLIKRIQKLATRRNDLVHSFYAVLTTAEGTTALTRQPTKLRPSVGQRADESEDIPPETLQKEIKEMEVILTAIEGYRLEVIDLKYPEN